MTERTTANQGEQDRWHVYIVLCGDGTLYTGITNDLDKRIEKHNAGSGARYTRARLPVSLLWHESHDSKSAALKREYAIKQLTRAQKDALIQTHSKA